MKRIIAVLLMWVIAFGLLAGCEKAPADAPVTSEKTGEPETTQIPTPTQSAEEQEILRILTIGNSHSNDANQMLWEVFRNEMPEQKVMLGVLYYSGCNMSQHYDYITKDKPRSILFGPMMTVFGHLLKPLQQIMRCRIINGMWLLCSR